MWTYNDLVDLLEEQHDEESVEEMLKGDLEVRLPPQETEHRKFPALDYDTLIEHMERHSYNPVKSPGGTTKDVEGEKNGMRFMISVHSDKFPESDNMRDVVDLEFEADTESSSDTERSFQNITENVVVELLNRERKLNLAIGNYVHSMLAREGDPVSKLETELGFYGDTVDEVAEGYFGDSRWSDLMRAYALQFELKPWQKAYEKRSDQSGVMPLADALENEDLKQRNKGYLKRYLGGVIESTIEEYGESDRLREYLMSYLD